MDENLYDTRESVTHFLKPVMKNHSNVFNVITFFICTDSVARTCSVQQGTDAILTCPRQSYSASETSIFMMDMTGGRYKEI